MRTILEMGKFPTCSHWLMWTADNREGTNIISDKSHILTGDRWQISARDLPFMKEIFNNLIEGSVYFQYISWNLHQTSYVRVLEEMREILMLTLVLSVKAAESNNSTVSHRQSKFLNLFSVIRFSNTPCSSKNGLNGTCYTDKQCQGRKKKTKMSVDAILRYIYIAIHFSTDWLMCKDVDFGNLLSWKQYYNNTTFKEILI